MKPAIRASPPVELFFGDPFPYSAFNTLFWIFPMCQSPLRSPLVALILGGIRARTRGRSEIFGTVFKIWRTEYTDAVQRMALVWTNLAGLIFRVVAEFHFLEQI